MGYMHALVHKVEGLYNEIHQFYVPPGGTSQIRKECIHYDSSIKKTPLWLL